jgi:hypothetical protein
MIHFDSDWLWLIPIIGQMTETVAANAHRVPVDAASIAATQSQVRVPRYVPFIRNSVVLNFIYFIPVALSRSVKLVINVSKSLTLKVFGSGQ